MHKFVYEFRGNNTYIIQDRTALGSTHLVASSFAQIECSKGSKGTAAVRVIDLLKAT